MIKDFRKNKVFNRRIAIIGGLQAGLISTLVIRLGYLQIAQYDEYTAKSDGNRIRSFVRPAPRGIILDRNSNPLTNNKRNYRLLLYTENKTYIKKNIEILSKILNLSNEDHRIITGRVKNARKKSIVSLIDNLAWDDLSRIESNYHRLKGVAIEEGVLRFYSLSFEAAHLVGYVSSPSEREGDGQYQNLFLHPDFKIGKIGIEKTFDEILRGKFGIQYVEVNAFGIPIRTLSTKNSTQGNNINLTIDADLQQFISNRVKDLAASVVVMDIKTGEIIAMVSNPSFDSNRFIEGVSKEYWQELIDDPQKPMNNKPISAVYPPGSTFKLMVAIAALENSISPDKKVFCNGSYQLGNRKFHCWKNGGHGNVNMSDAIKHSCNVYFFDIANQIGIDNITQVAQKFGYGESFDIGLYGVKSGNLPSEEWKQKIFNQPLVGGDTLNTAIGQGFVLASALQMVVATSRLVNGGIPIVPYLVKNSNTNNQYQDLQNRPLTAKSNIDLVVEGMRRVVNEEGGTAYGKRITKKGFEMIGKTGTSQVISKREDDMSQEEIDNNQNHAIFVGAVPINSFKYAIAVVIENGGSGSSTAAPIGKDVMLEWQTILSNKII